MERRETKFGDKFLTKLFGVDDAVWVQQKDLSAGVAECFKTQNPLPKKAKSHVNRGFVEKTKRHGTQLLESGDSSASPSPKKKHDPIKLARKHAGWIVTVQSYVSSMNSVLSCVPAKRTAALKQLVAKLNPPLFVMPSLIVQSFLDGTYQIWNAKDPILHSVKGLMRCTVCEKNFK